MNKKELYIWIILISMSTAFSFAVDDRQMNMYLTGLMIFIPFLLIVQYPYIHKKEVLIYILFFAILISGLLHLGSFRISTVFYTLLFLLTFVYYFRLITLLPLDIDIYIKILKFILIAYFVVLVIQQFCVLLNAPFILNFIAGTTDTFKLNSLSPEPSHTARIIMVSMYSYISMLELKLDRPYNLIKDGKNDYIWLIFLYPMFTMGSGFAIVLVLFFLIKFIEFKKAIYMLFLIIIAFIIVLNLNLPAVDRVMRFGEAFLKLDPNLMMVADHSASIRVVPTFLYFTMFDVLNINTWVGFGIDYSANLIPTLMPGIPEGEFRGGLFPDFFIDKGLICVAILFAMINKFCLRKFISFDTFILLLLIFASGVNTQLFWISIMLFTTNKYLNQTYTESLNFMN